MSKTMMSAPLSQEQMESLVKEYCFKLWKEKDLPVLAVRHRPLGR